MWVVGRLIPVRHNAAGGGGEVALNAAAGRPTSGLHLMSTGNRPPRAAERRNTTASESAPDEQREFPPPLAGGNGPPPVAHTTAASIARDAAFALLDTLHELREIGRVAEPVPEDDRTMVELGNKLLVGNDGRGGVRADLERALARCRDAVTALLPRLTVGRQMRVFDLEGTPYPTATHALIDRAGRALYRLGTVRRGWSGRAVSNECERLYGVLRSDLAGGLRRSPGILPADIERLRVDIDTEFAPLLVLAEAERPATPTPTPAPESDAGRLYWDGPTRFGVYWRGRDIPFDVTERREWQVVEAVWPPEQGKRLAAGPVKARVGSKARHAKWAVNAASEVNKVFGKYPFFPFRLIGGKEGGGEFLQWEEVSNGTR